MISLGISRYGNGLHDISELIREIIKEKEAMTDRLHSCKDSPDGRHTAAVDSFMCRYCHRTMSYLMDQGWRAPSENAAEQLVRKANWNTIEDGTE